MVICYLNLTNWNRIELKSSHSQPVGYTHVLSTKAHHYCGLWHWNLPFLQILTDGHNYTSPLFSSVYSFEVCVTPAAHLIFTVSSEQEYEAITSNLSPSSPLLTFSTHIHHLLSYFIPPFSSHSICHCSCWLRLDTYFIWSFIGPATLIIMVSVTPFSHTHTHPSAH